MTKLVAPGRLRPAAFLCAALLLPLAPARAADDQSGGANFANLSLEELTNIQVTSVSRHAERLGDTPASIFVIRADDIRRAGAQTLPEALRLAPNLQVARVDARNYAVTARGFSSPFENKLLVLIDGRTVYSPLFSGVYWDAQDVVMDDIDRIEVISGPGATVWGANAVNGVINIITRSSAATQGTLADLGGSGAARDASARYGARAGSAYYRLYAKYFQQDDLRRQAGPVAPTGMQRRQAGFRADLPVGLGEATISGDAYHGQLHQAGTRDILIGGANLLGHVTHAFEDGSQLRVQAYLDHTERDQPGAFVEELDTFDLDLQHLVRLSPVQLLIWGGGHRAARDHLVNGKSFSFLPARTTLAWTNLFAQDEITLAGGLRVNLGLKFERNSYTGVETLPYAGLAWNVTPDHMLWTSLSRAVRAPSRIDRDIYAPSVPRVVNGVPQYALAGGPDFDSEVADVLQAGCRGQPLATLSYALTLHYSRYDRLRTLEPNRSGPGSVFRNEAEGNTYGAELTASWNVKPWLRVTVGHALLHEELHGKPGSMDTTAGTGLANNDPAHWSSVRVSWDVTDSMEFDVNVRHVGALPSPQVPGYTAADVRAGWQLSPSLELALMVQNLGADGHGEFSPAATRMAYDRTAAARLTWRF
ncbi:MAG: TonB-dependent receptor plug domain-containing protein [Telluria sp.]